jgi:hypothetical protein
MSVRLFIQTLYSEAVTLVPASPNDVERAQVVRQKCPCGRYWAEPISSQTLDLDGHFDDGVEQPGAVTAAELSLWATGKQSHCIGACKRPWPRQNSSSTQR